MRLSHETLKRRFQRAAIALLLVYASVTAAVDLFHNHPDLVERDDCPACVWHQISQEHRLEIGAAEQLVIQLAAVTCYLPPAREAERPADPENITSAPIRAPPSC